MLAEREHTVRSAGGPAAARFASGWWALIPVIGWFLASGGCARTVMAEEGGQARSFLLNLELLQIAKEALLAEDPFVTQKLRSVVSQANGKLNKGPYSVVYTPLVAPSGDPHDYVSYGAYWWPNPDTEDGLPWIRRDGHINPDNGVDFAQLCDMGRSSELLSLAYFFTEDEKYAEKAADLIRTWFIDPETRMNPRNEYAQIVPNRYEYYDVAGFGNCIPMAFDTAGLLEQSPAWSADDSVALKAWTNEFAAWAQTAPKGVIQFNEPSNHGTNYDFLLTMFSLYHEDEATARQSILHYLENRMPGQIDSDGSNPLEKLRANSLLYHRYNLGRAFDLATLSRHFDDLDAFQYETEDGRGLRLQLDFLLPYMLGEKSWEFWNGEVFPREPGEYYVLLREAAVYFQDPLLLDAADQLGYTSYHYVNLTHPRQAVAEKLPGDLNADGALSVEDIDLHADRMNRPQVFYRYDFNGDRRVDLEDRRILVEEIFGTTFGDANLDGQFASDDLVEVLQWGQYGDAVANNSTWSSGDWDGDLEFDSGDLVLALQAGGYERSSLRAAKLTADACCQQTFAVPEPSAAALLSLGSLSLVDVARRRKKRVPAS